MRNICFLKIKGALLLACVGSSKYLFSPSFRDLDIGAVSEMIISHHVRVSHDCIKLALLTRVKDTYIFQGGLDFYMNGLIWV